MLARVHTRDLRVGMYIEMPMAWWAHPFPRSRFRISSTKLLRQVQEFHDGEVGVDWDRSIISDSAEDEPEEQAPAAAPATPRPEPAPIVVRRVDSLLARPEPTYSERARNIHGAARLIVESFLEAPSWSNIRAAKEAVGHIVEVVAEKPALIQSLFAVSAHDSSTYTHSVNVGVYSIALATQLYADAPEHDLAELGAGFFLHDIGKARIDRVILNKRGPLTPEETAKMRKHPEFGLEILVETQADTPMCRDIVLQHHERYDGTGYPFGLTGDQISEYARVCSIADVFDALVSVRPYKPSMSSFAALRIMRDEMLDHFQRDVFETFVRLFEFRKAA